MRACVVILAALFIAILACGAASAASTAPEYLKKELAAREDIPEGTWLLISKEHFTLFVMEGETPVESFGVAVARNKGQKERRGDNRTPEGMFSVIQIQNASAWTHDFRDGKGEIKGAYGPWFIRLDAFGWQGIGIHGTHDPASTGTNASEGCIRLQNQDVDRLRSQYVKVGIPVLILR